MEHVYATGSGGGGGGVAVCYLLSLPGTPTTHTHTPTTTPSLPSPKFVLTSKRATYTLLHMSQICKAWLSAARNNWAHYHHVLSVTQHSTSVAR